MQELHHLFQSHGDLMVHLRKEETFHLHEHYALTPHRAMQAQILTETRTFLQKSHLSADDL
jgi:hypothetical protein